MAYTSYKELKVWQKSMELTGEIYRLAKKCPQMKTMLCQTNFGMLPYQFRQTLQKVTDGKRKTEN